MTTSPINEAEASSQKEILAGALLDPPEPQQFSNTVKLTQSSPLLEPADHPNSDLAIAPYQPQKED